MSLKAFFIELLVVLTGAILEQRLSAHFSFKGHIGG
jgi:hypothetical protein